MRIFLASDIHGARAALSELPARALLQGADIIVLAGDISHRGKPRGFIEELVAGFRGLPVLAVPGNLDPPEVHGDFAKAGALSIHEGRIKVEGLGFAGMGGSTPHFFGGPYQVSEQKIELGLRLAEPGDVLVVHCPPRGTLDKTTIGIRAGSHAAAAAVARLRPKLVLCGHVHEARGVLERDGTLYVNAGPGKKLCSALVVGSAEKGFTATLHR
ncbi:MAG: metallophosphoesterase family protein [Planctomycetota bacterium]